MTPPFTSPIRLLFLAANPEGTVPLQLEVEAEAIGGLDSAHLNCLAASAASYADLERGVLQYRPHIVHFAGHGTEGGYVLLQEPDGTLQPVKGQSLADLLGHLRTKPYVVLLNACWSEAAATPISEHVPYVISMAGQMSNEAARRFSHSFYQSLVAGESLPAAFGIAKTHLGVTDQTEVALPRFLPWTNPPVAPWLEQPQVTTVGPKTGGTLLVVLVTLLFILVQIVPGLLYHSPLLSGPSNLSESTPTREAGDEFIASGCLPDADRKKEDLGEMFPVVTNTDFVMGPDEEEREWRVKVEAW